MKNILKRFQNTFGVEKPYLDGEDKWLRLHIDQRGLVLLQVSYNYEGCVEQLAWYRRKLVLIDATGDDLCLLVYVAEKLGLPTQDPALDEARQRDEYKRLIQTGQINLD